MKKILSTWLLCLAASLSAETTPPQGIIVKTPQLQAFTHARLVISSDLTIENGTLVVDRGKIVAVGENIAIPDGAVVIDLSGKTIYPGFIDPFTQYGLKIEEPLPQRRGGRPPVYEGTRSGGNAWNDAIHAEKNWIAEFEPNSEASEPFQKLGFTTVQSARQDGVFRGRGFVTSLGAGLANDLVIRSVADHQLSFDKGRSHQEYPSSEMGSIAMIRQMYLDVTWYQQAQAAYLKNHNQKMPEFNRAIEALAGPDNTSVLFQTNNQLSLLRADKLAREFDFPVVLVGSGHEYERIKEIKATGRTLILPVDFPEVPGVTSSEDELDVSLATLRYWDWAPSNPARLEESDIRFAFTTHGLKDKSCFLSNVRRAVARGLTVETALAALTRVPAEICGVAEAVGTLETGKLADFFICSGDIFDKEAKVFSVYSRGVKKEFLSLDDTDFSGYFATEVSGIALYLSLMDKGAGEECQVEGSFKRDSLSAKLENITYDRDRISFSAALDTFGLIGVARFTARRTGNQLIGQLVAADGSRSAWQAAITDKPAADSTDAESCAPPDKDESDILTARLTYPNLAFGLEQLPQTENVLVKNATIWTSDEAGVLENADLLIKDGLIEAVGTNLKAPSGYRLIDATGKHVTAGIIDEHSHVAISGAVNEGTDAITSEVRIADIVNSDDISIYRSLAGGTTAARLLHGSANPIGGQAQFIKFRWGSPPEDLKMTEAPPSIKFALGENVKQSNWGDQQTIRYPQTRMGVETLIRDAFQTAREYEADWQDYNRLSRKEREKTVPPRTNLRWQALLDVLNKEMFITCHSYVQSEILMLMRVAESFDFTVTTFTHILEGYKVADEMAAHGAAAGSFSDWWAYKFEVYDAIPYNPGLMHQKGVLVSINSDSRDLQRRLNQEAAKSVQYCGISHEDALDMITINPAKQLKADQYIGSLKAGKQADFVIWSGHPLSIYSHPEQTWVDGKKYFDLNDDLRYRAEIAEEKNSLIQKALKTTEKPDKWEKRKGRKRPHQAFDHGHPNEKGVSHETTR